MRVIARPQFCFFFGGSSARAVRLKIVSWNVNGIRAALRKGLLGFLGESDADVFCLQETKAQFGDVQHVKWPGGLEVHWNSAQRKGYSGTAVLTRVRPLATACGIGRAEHDREGRVLALEFPDFWLVNVYQPNSQRGLTRLDYRVGRWDPAFRAYLKRLQSRGKPAVFCGDLNVAHEEIDLANPRANRRNAGFTDEERASFSRLLDGGYVDTFREFEKGPGHYTWWSQMGDCRARNVGWRVDYFVAAQALRPALRRAWISPEVMGSDHCPVGLEIG
jgi:exodeoxyribonuclease-3